MLVKPDHCKGCYGWQWGCNGYVPASGTGENGVLVVAEAAGEHETIEGMPLVGKAGFYLWQNLGRIGIQREGFKCHNVLSCRPPENKLAKQEYEDRVIAYCSPLLDATIADMQRISREHDRTFTIVTLGQIAFKRIMGITSKDPILKEEYLAYPFRSWKYDAWVYACDHPSYLMRGANHLLPVLQFTFQRALQVAEQGLKLDVPEYLLDPDPATFAQWVRDYLKALEGDPSLALSYDIETAYKQGKGEDELGKADESDDMRIIRVSFSYRPNQAVSVPWRAEYLPYIEEAFASNGPKVGWNSENYDNVRILQHCKINGDLLDAMLMWHILHSALDKKLGFVTPFYVPNTELWKHLSSSEPAFYNAKDADMALRCYYGIRRDLVRNGQWPIFERHVIELNRVLAYMSGKGVMLDQTERKKAEEKLQTLLDVTEIKMEAAVPKEARRVKIYKKAPKDVSGMDQIEKSYPVPVCLVCGELRPRRTTHSRLCSNDGAQYGHIDVPSLVWAKPLGFKVSKLGLSNYQKVLQHQAILSRKEKKVTFDENAILKLVKKYPHDQLYPLILEHREVQKLLSTYVGTTQYEEVQVADDYKLNEGEKWSDAI